MFKNDDLFANRDMLDIVIEDYGSKIPRMSFPYGNSTATALDGNVVYAYGGHGHPKRVAFHGDKGGTFTLETQMLTAQLFSIATGASIKQGGKFIKRVEKTATAGVITLDEGSAPIAGSVNVFKAGDDCGAVIASTVSGTKVTLTDNTSNDDYIVYYLENLADAQSLSIKSSVFPKPVIIYGSTSMESENGDTVAYKETIYKAVPQSKIDIKFANNGDPASVSLVFDMLADKDDNMIDMLFLKDE